MQVTRRDFLKLVGVSAAAIGLSAADLGHLEEALANPSAPSVIWLQGASCTGCSVSFLNRVSTTAPVSAADVLVNSINLVYHPQLMSLAGQSAVAAAQTAYNKGGYILVLEGGIPTAFNGGTCFAWTFNGVDVTFKDAVTTLANSASILIAAGTCASYGGVAAAPPNPTGVKGLKDFTGKSVINIPGCPTHPDWLVWTIVQLLLNNPMPLDSNGRPTGLFSRTVHSQCPRRETDEAGTFGVDKHCLRELGCRGPETICSCPTTLWNGKTNWCIDANAPCIGCTSPTFPGTGAFYTRGGSSGNNSTTPTRTSTGSGNTTPTYGSNGGGSGDDNQGEGGRDD